MLTPIYADITSTLSHFHTCTQESLNVIIEEIEENKVLIPIQEDKSQKKTSSRTTQLHTYLRISRYSTPMKCWRSTDDEYSFHSNSCNDRQSTECVCVRMEEPKSSDLKICRLMSHMHSNFILYGLTYYLYSLQLNGIFNWSFSVLFNQNTYQSYHAYGRYYGIVFL